MRAKILLVVIVCILVATGNAWAAYTAHIGGVAGGTIYVKANGVVPGHAAHTPDNSPLHESWDLITPGSPNFLGSYAKFIFYDGTMHIDPTGKVGWTDTIWVGCNQAGGYGKLEVEGILTGNKLRPWKSGVTMDVSVMGGMLEATECNVGIADTGNNRGIINLSGGIAKFDRMSFYDVGVDSYIDITGGELLVLNSNWSEAQVQAQIGVNILNSTGEGLDVSTRTVNGSLYTSVTIVPEPATILILGFGSCLALLRRK